MVKLLFGRARRTWRLRNSASAGVGRAAFVARPRAASCQSGTPSFDAFDGRPDPRSLFWEGAPPVPSSQSIREMTASNIKNGVIYLFDIFLISFDTFSTILGGKKRRRFSNIHRFLVFNSGAAMPSLLALVFMGILASF